MGKVSVVSYERVRRRRCVWAAAFLAAVFLAALMPSLRASARELSPDISLPGGGGSAALKDGSYGTGRDFQGGAIVKVKASGGVPMSGIYIIWDSPVKPWTLTADGRDIACGGYGFLHEYIPLDAPAQSVEIHIPDGGMRISDIRVFGEGELPGDVQVWNPPAKRADILLVPSHADDEILFFGGILPTYAVVENAELQVAYMTEFWSTTKVREHEKLDGLWASGLKNYPGCGNFTDVYSNNLKTAETQYSLEDVTAYLVEEIRRCKPQVVVTHDRNGEYGHGFHMLTSKAVVAAVSAAADETAYADSYAAYGAWDVPKLYLHLYEENKIRMDLRQPIAQMGGRTALEIAKDAYKKHVSQQRWWFYVSDEYEYSCADFGLYRTTVGTDTGNDMLEHLKTYREQEAEALEKVRGSARQIWGRFAGLSEAAGGKRRFALVQSVPGRQTVRMIYVYGGIAAGALILVLSAVSLVLARIAARSRRRRRRR